MANLVKFIACTNSQYAGLEAKDANTLYFISDTQQIFKGDVPYTQKVEVVSSFPESGQRQGTIYINSATKQSQYWDGSAWQSLSIEIVTTIPESPVDTNVPSTKAICDWVKNQIETSTVGVGAVSYDNATRKLTVTANGETTETFVAGLVTDYSYESTTGVVTLTLSNAAGATETKTINLPLEQALTGVTQHTVTAEEAGTGIYADAAEGDVGLLLTVTNLGDSTTTQYFVSLKNFVDVYTSGTVATDSVEVIVSSSDNTIKANLRYNNTEFQINAANGQLELKQVGGDKIVISGATNGNIVSVDASGHIVDSGKKVGGSTLAGAPDENTLATEAGVKAYADSAASTAAGNKMSKIAGTANTVILGDATGEAVRSTKTLGGATLAESASADVLATEAAVADALTWKTLA